MELRSTD